MMRKTSGLLTLFAALLVGGVAFAEGMDEIPADIVAKVFNPDLMDPAQPLGISAYRDWKATTPPPWTIGYASTYAGNTWRAAAMDRLMNEAEM
jgi:ribose transport system substrate-binding protein